MWRLVNCETSESTFFVTEASKKFQLGGAVTAPPNGHEVVGCSVVHSSGVGGLNDVAASKSSEGRIARIARQMPEL